jgi:hypothetical protein
MHTPNYVDSEFFMTFPICIRCVHLREGLKCDAFPDGIPDEILQRDNDHHEPCCGQKNNIVFEEGVGEYAKSLPKFKKA